VSELGKTAVAIFFGGQSSEHEISCLTTIGVFGALDASRFDAYGVGIGKDGRWVRYDAREMAAMGVVDGRFPTVDETRAEAVLSHEGGRVYLSTRQGDTLTDTVAIDIAMPLLHGPFGEDGTIQGLFEMLGLRYVGAGVAASAVGMDKQLMKVAFAAAGLRVEPYLVFGPATPVDEVVAAVAGSEVRYPVFVKPARGGSSVGISKVKSQDGLPAALALARRFDPKVLVEQGVEDAREIECAVLGPKPGGDGAVRASRPGEIIVHNADRFYDYEAKYVSADTAEVVAPADLPAQLVAEIRASAVRAFNAIGAEGLSRVDFLVPPDGSVIVNEINTMPGFTEISAFPLMWRVDGMSYPALVTDLIDQALARPVGVVR